MNRTVEVLDEVAERRIEQDLRFDEQEHDQSYWSAVLAHELGEYNSCILMLRQGKELDAKGRDLIERMRSKLLDIAATAVVARENLDEEIDTYQGNVLVCRDSMTAV